MDMRELKALEIAARNKITFNLGRWLVPSQNGNGIYKVTIDPPVCQCEDYQLRGGLACKHIIAAKLVRERDGGEPSPEVKVDEIPKRKTYKQIWPLYNLAQTTEKDRFQELLHDLCQGIEEPERSKKATRQTAMKDMIFASAFKVFSTLSSRRFMCDLRDAHERGYLSAAMDHSSIMNFINSETMTPYLTQLIERAAMPLRLIETTFASDSTGFMSSRFIKWHDEKYGERSGREWVKAHAMVGCKTNIITAVKIEGPHSGDSPQFKPLVEATVANGFKLGDVTADKAYLGHDNLELVAHLGGTPFIPFKSNSLPGEPDSLWNRMYGYFQFRRQEFLDRYHQRSNVESTFSMVKAKFRDHVRSKTDVSMKNEVLLKFLCHNVVVIHQAIIELGIDGTFWPGPNDENRDVIPLCRNQRHSGELSR